MTAKTIGTLCAALSIFTASQAAALSCVRPTIESSYNSWADSPDRYFIATGKLVPLSPLPKVPNPGELNGAGGAAPVLRAVYRFQGELIGVDDNTPLDHVVWVRVGCAGPWCGRFPAANADGVFAFKHMPDYTLEASFGPCGGDIFEDPKGSVQVKIKSCMADGRCEDNLSGKGADERDG